MIGTPEEAREAWICPMSGADELKCMGPNCAAWRWKPLMADDPRFVAAIKAEQQRLADAEGKPNSGGYHKKAVAAVMADKGAHGLPESPERGYCGLGGKPDATG